MSVLILKKYIFVKGSDFSIISSDQNIVGKAAIITSKIIKMPFTLELAVVCKKVISFLAIFETKAIKPTATNQKQAN